ncbi:hypothetical protein ACERZ8_05975 [Tateyamaria armeniaca]|uniref:DUF559 domain-containing protein n=1 Tax=Tateyamaria armeniaca TaxID=2518930 RepID=A0ABW8URT5_9RHOB
MSISTTQDRLAAEQVLDLATRERAKALSRREWKHRLAGFGYNIRETDAGDVIETLRSCVQVCVLPSALSA